MTIDSRDGLWEQGWEGHERAQLLRLSRLALPEKIRWLEEAHAVVLALQRARATRAHDSGRMPRP